jgi:hypothetical protein
LAHPPPSPAPTRITPTPARSPSPAAILTVSQTGTTPSFTNSGAITINSPYALSVTGGTFNQAGGSIGGTGTLSLTGVAADFATSFSNATTGLVALLSSISGAGTITNDAAKTLTLFGTTINAPLVNNGVLEATDDSFVNGSFTSGAGSTIRARGNSVGGASSITFANGFTNNGTIELTASDNAQNASIAVTTGTLTNAAGRTISLLAGTGGQRFIAASFANAGTMNVSAATSVIKADAVLSNSGTINVTGANFTVAQSGTSPSFTNTGTLNISASRVLTISSGQFNQNAGSITGSGTFSLLNATASFATSFSNATTAFAVAGSTISGTGTITNAAGRQITLTNTVFNTPFSNESLLLSKGTADAINGTFTSVAGSIVRVQGNSGSAAGTSLTFANGFTSNGQIDLTSIEGVYNATLTVTAGRLTNASGRNINLSAGTGGNRAFNAQFTNNGVININAPTTITKASASQVNIGTLNVANADLTVALSGTSPSFTNFGTIYVVNGRTFTLTGATLSNSGFIRSGGTVVANVSNSGIVSPERPGNGSTVYYENFNYSSGSQLNGQAGWVEPGLSDPFSNDFATPELIQSGSLAFPNLSTSGRSVQTQGLYSFDSNTMPSFLGANNTYWVGFLIRRDTTGAGGMAGEDYGGLQLGLGPGIFIGKPGGGAGVNNWSLERGDAAQQASSSVASQLGVTAFLVARIVLNDDGIPGTSGADLDTVTLYVNPAPGTAEGSLVPAATLSMELFDFNNLGLSTGSSAKWSFDEIRAGTSFSDVAPRAASITSLNGNFVQGSGALAIDIAGPTLDTQQDQLIVNGGVSLSGSILLNGTFTPVGMQTFTIIDNDGVDPVSGTFTGLSEGATFVGSSGRTFRVSYVGGTGNDVTLTYLPAITISDLTITEGTGGTTVANFTVSLSDAGSATSTVQWATSNGTATTPGDYTAASGTVTFNPFVTSQQVSVTINPDALDEVDETFNITLSNPTNSVISDGSAVGTISDDDPPPSITINDVTLTEGDSGTQNAVYTVTLSAVSAKTITVTAATANGTAVAPGDYAAITSQLLTFNPGDLTKTVTVTINSDLLDEVDETYFVNLSGASNGTITDSQGLGTINNNDPQPNLTINDVTITEGDAGTQNAVFTVSLSAASGKTVTVNAATANGTAVAPGDYTAIASQLVTFNPGDLTKTVTVAINGDVLDETDETYFVNLSGATNAGITDSQGLGTITDNDPLPNITVNDVTLTEGDSGTQLATFTISLSAASGRDVTLNYATANGTATAGSDYTALASTPLTFLPGETSKQVSVTVNGDVLSENSETFFLNLSGAANGTITDNQGLGTITDNDPLPNLSINDVSVTEGDSAPSWRPSPFPSPPPPAATSPSTTPPPTTPRLRQAITPPSPPRRSPSSPARRASRSASRSTATSRSRRTRRSSSTSAAS